MTSQRAFKKRVRAHAHENGLTYTESKKLLDRPRVVNVPVGVADNPLSDESYLTHEDGLLSWTIDWSWSKPNVASVLGPEADIACERLARAVSNHARVSRHDNVSTGEGIMELRAQPTPAVVVIECDRYYFTDPEDREQRLKGKLFDQILQSFLMKSRSLGFIPILRGSGYGLETTMWMMNNGVTLIPELEARKGRELGSNGLRSNSFALREDTWA